MIFEYNVSILVINKIYMMYLLRKYFRSRKKIFQFSFRSCIQNQSIFLKETIDNHFTIPPPNNSSSIENNLDKNASYFSNKSLMLMTDSFFF